MGKIGRKGNFWKNWIKLEEWDKIGRMGRIKKIVKIWKQGKKLE